MKTEVRNDRQMFDESISILVTAFFKNELEHSSCTGCAVANLMRGRGFIFKDYASATNWLTYIDQEIRKSRCSYDSSIYNPKEAVAQIQSSGYSAFEVHLIEQAFEQTPFNYILAEENHPAAATEQWMFDGLMSVVECLALIHGVDLSVKESAKLLFVKS